MQHNLATWHIRRWRIQTGLVDWFGRVLCWGWNTGAACCVPVDEIGTGVCTITPSSLCLFLQHFAPGQEGQRKQQSRIPPTRHTKQPITTPATAPPCAIHCDVRAWGRSWSVDVCIAVNQMISCDVIRVGTDLPSCACPANMAAPGEILICSNLIRRIET